MSRSHQLLLSLRELKENRSSHETGYTHAIQWSVTHRLLAYMTAPAISNNGFVTAVSLLGRRQNRLVAGGALGCDPLPLPSRDIFCSELLAEVQLMSGGHQDLGRQHPMHTGSHAAQTLVCHMQICFGQSQATQPQDSNMHSHTCLSMYPGPCWLQNPPPPAPSCILFS